MQARAVTAALAAEEHSVAACYSRSSCSMLVFMRVLVQPRWRRVGTASGQCGELSTLLTTSLSGDQAGSGPGWKPGWAHVGTQPEDGVPPYTIIVVLP